MFWPHRVHVFEIPFRGFCDLKEKPHRNLTTQILFELTICDQKIYIIEHKSTASSYNFSVCSSVSHFSCGSVSCSKLISSKTWPQPNASTRKRHVSKINKSLLSDHLSITNSLNSNMSPIGSSSDNFKTPLVSSIFMIWSTLSSGRRVLSRSFWE